MPAPVQQQRSTPLLPGADAGLLRQLQRGLQAAEVDLLPHDEFPQLALGSAVDRLHVFQTDVGT